MSDQYEALPDSLYQIQRRLELVQTNQSQVLLSITNIFHSVSELETRLQVMFTHEMNYIDRSEMGEKCF